MQIIKRSGAEAPFDKQKIVAAISKANASVEESERIPEGRVRWIADRIEAEATGATRALSVEEVQDKVEEALMSEGYFSLARSYITYRYEHAKLREDNALMEKLTASNVQNQNANMDEASFSGRMGETMSLVAKKFALEHVLSKKSARNHNNNEIYIHDLDSYAVGMHNCLSCPMDKLLAEGFKTRQCDVRPAGSINTALQLVAVIFQLQSLQQFGGVAATHLDHTCVPYIRLSYWKHYRVGMQFLRGKVIEDRTKDDIRQIQIDDYSTYTDPKVREYALACTVTELNQAVEGLYHNLCTLQSRAGAQLPFSSINYGTCTLPEGRMVIRALLEGSIKGVGKFHKTPIFPCGIFQCMKGVNRKPGDPNYDLFRLALKSTSLRLYPNYANVDWSGNAGYDPENPQTYFSTMGCLERDTPVLMADGTKKAVQEVVVGDLLMGVKGQKRKVESLIRGTAQLFRVHQLDSDFVDYTVNEGHILSLVYMGEKPFMGHKTGDMVNISVHDYLALPEEVRSSLKGYRWSGVMRRITDIDVSPSHVGGFFGFELDGDRLHLLGDGTVTHNCRTANGWDINCDDPKLGQLKDGRGNLSPVTLVLPTLAMQASRKAKRNGTNAIDEFMVILDKKIDEARDMLLERYRHQCAQSAKSARFMYENGTFYGYKPEEGVESALKHGTLAIGQLGLAETLQILIGCDHTEQRGMDAAKRIEQLFKDKCAAYKKDLKLNFGVYYTPAENLCYTAMKKFKEKYGVIPNVSDRDYFCNSVHVPVWKKITPFEKIDIESQLTGYSSAGCITYVELDASAQGNIDALEDLVNYAMDKDIPYFALNLPNDSCEDCGFTGDIGGKCPQCGGTDIKRLRRVTGYLTGSYKEAFNLGKQQETEMRVKHNGVEA